MKYENRIVAFIDILGFKDMLDKTTNKDDEDVEPMIDAIMEAYEIIRDAWDLDKATINITPSTKEMLEKESKRKRKIVTIFSDTIVVSFLQTAPGELYWTLTEIHWMIINLVNRGILCRGAVANGKLIHNENVIFGPALVQAYITESKAALYPRVILSKELISLASKHGEHEEKEETQYLEAILKKDTDGMFYVDYFWSPESEMDDPEYDFPSYISKMADLIRKGVRSRRPDVSIKYMWMKEKVNAVLNHYKNDQSQNRFIANQRKDLAKIWKGIRNA